MPFSHLSMPPLPARVRRSSHIAHVIETMIAEGRLRAGDRLPTEAQLCEQFDVSRTTLREAIQMLRSNGLLDVTPGRGSYVRAPAMEGCLHHLLVAAHAHGLAGSEDVHGLHQLVLGHVLGKLGSLTSAEQANLQQHTLAAHASADDNTRHMHRWQLALAEAARTPLARSLLHALLELNQGFYHTCYANVDNVMRAIHTQLRVHAALATRDVEGARRALFKLLDDDRSTTPLHANAA